MAWRVPTSLLNRLDLPTFGRPTIATRGVGMLIMRMLQIVFYKPLPVVSIQLASVWVAAKRSPASRLRYHLVTLNTSKADETFAGCPVYTQSLYHKPDQ